MSFLKAFAHFLGVSEEMLRKFYKERDEPLPRLFRELDPKHASTIIWQEELQKWYKEDYPDFKNFLKWQNFRFKDEEEFKEERNRKN